MLLEHFPKSRSPVYFCQVDLCIKVNMLRSQSIVTVLCITILCKINYKNTAYYTEQGLFLVSHPATGLPHPWKTLNILEKIGLFSRPWIWSKLNKGLENPWIWYEANVFEILCGLSIILWEDHSSWGERKWGYLIIYILKNVVVDLENPKKDLDSCDQKSVGTLSQASFTRKWNPS